MGACTTRGPGPQPSDLHGQLDEFRVWKVQRTAEQIRDGMSKKLTGREPGLVGLWNFDDPENPGRDASPGAHHGKLIGQATTVKAALPAIVYGKITDASGKSLASASEDGTVKCWDLQTGALNLQLKKHSATVNAIAFSPDGTMMATGGDDRTVIIWDPVSGKSRRTLKGHDLTVTSLAFSPDGDLLAAGSGNASVVLWDARSGKLNRVLK